VELVALTYSTGIHLLREHTSVLASEDGQCQKAANKLNEEKVKMLHRGGDLDRIEHNVASLGEVLAQKAMINCI